MTGGVSLTDTGAVAAVTSPIWLPSLHTISEFAALMLPILGAIWLGVQIVVKLHGVFSRRGKQ